MAKKRKVKGQSVATEIHALAAETLATQVVLGQMLFRIGKIDPKLSGAIVQAFDDAAHIIENLAMKLGGAGDPAHSPAALKVVEELRQTVLGPGPEPRHGV